MQGMPLIKSGSPWHEGELTIQARVGVVEKMAAVGRTNIRDHLIEQHRTFFPLLPFIVVGAVDLEGDAWATILSGRPGFLQAPDPKTLRISGSANPADPAFPGMQDGDPVGLLGIALDTRRRNRMNGTIRRIDDTTFDVVVERSFGNCPRYIQLRKFSFAREPMTVIEETPQIFDGLEARAVTMIEKADALFVASYLDGDGERGVDVSHRGGKPGFVRVDNDGVLTIPDFAGNLHFATLGNILLNPKCGLIFVNFETGDVLQLTGDGEVLLDSPKIAAFQGAERLWRFKPRQSVFRPNALAVRFAAGQSRSSPSR